MSNSSLLFFTAVNSKYHQFVLPLYGLQHNLIMIQLLKFYLQMKYQMELKMVLNI